MRCYEGNLTLVACYDLSCFFRRADRLSFDVSQVVVCGLLERARPRHLNRHYHMHMVTQGDSVGTWLPFQSAKAVVSHVIILRVWQIICKRVEMTSKGLCANEPGPWQRPYQMRMGMHLRHQNICGITTRNGT